jgi:hypothetical protein
MKKKINKIVRRQPEEVENKPARITNDNLAEHREEVLGRARRFIYPLQHSKHKLVLISTTLLLTAIVIFVTYCVVALYKVKSNSEFLYQVTKVVPFPIARIGSDFVEYENYLFETSHYIHYYETQQNVDFNSDSGKQQLADFRKRALNKVINEAYVRQIASQKGISVSDQEVDQEVAIYRGQNRLGSSEKELEVVLNDWWGWSMQDFRHSLKQQLLNRKVIAELDTEARAKAEDALKQLKEGKDFEKLAEKVSEDPATKNNGGNFGPAIDQDNRDVPPKTVEALFSLEPGEFSEIINIGYGLEIVKSIERQDDKVEGAHIVFNFKDIEAYLGATKDQTPARSYITL